jgi:hypothetical protein
MLNMSDPLPALPFKLGLSCWSGKISITDDIRS